MEIILVFAIVAVSAVVLIMAGFVAGNIAESVYMLIFKKPIFVHYYYKMLALRQPEIDVLEKQFKYYHNLSDKRKKFFNHRVYSFIGTYKFEGREGVEVTLEMKVKVAATYVMLTFGMREYLTNAFETIVIYPDAFESRSGDYYLGEFIPAAKTVVFSWPDFIEGIEFDTNNLNLGLHEFAHVLHNSSMKRRRLVTSAAIYGDMFDEIVAYLAKPGSKQKIIDANYFRGYAYTNEYEFMAVVFEHFFETPAEFKAKLPELYGLVKTMINFSE
jgi:Mlc titration factor MtfA (ptsG expression regulator)